MFASHLVNHRSHLVWPPFFLNRWEYTFVIDCSRETGGDDREECARGGGKAGERGLEIEKAKPKKLPQRQPTK